MGGPRDIGQYLPLKPAVFHILLVLAEHEAHGYGIMQSVRKQSRGAIQLETGPLYRHLHRLFEAALVEEADRHRRPAGEDPRRRTYRLTALGRRVLAAEAERLAQLVEYSRGLNLLDRPQTA